MTEQSNMDRLRDALRAGRRVEVDEHMSLPTASLMVSGENAEDDAEANASGQRIASIMDEHGEPESSCRVIASEARELVAAGAVKV